MASWHDIHNEISSMVQNGARSHDIVRRKYLKRLQNYTKRNVICYYSGWLQKPDPQLTGVNDSDKNGLMTVINKLDVNKGLDLILHTPGGDIAATESIVDYLLKKFGKDIRCFVPQLAMSAGTMIACSCKEIHMGKQSSLGPVDPQFRGIPAHAVLEEFKRARDEISADPRTVPLWQPIINKYSPTLLGECDKAIKWSTTLVKEWLSNNMLASVQDKDAVLKKISEELIDHAVSLSHSRHLSAEKCKEIGLTIVPLENDQKLQDAVLSVHHAFIHTLSATPAIKIIENHNGIAFVTQVTVQHIQGPVQAVQMQTPPGVVDAPKDDPAEEVKQA